MQITWSASPHPLVPPADPLYTRARSLAIREGAAGFLKTAGNRVWTSLFGLRKAVVYGRNLDFPIPDVSARVPVLVRQMTSDDVDRFRDRRYHLRERRIASFVERLRAGRIGVIALCEDQAAGYGWLSLKNERDVWIGADISLEMDEGYLYDGYVFPDFRGKGVYLSLLALRLALLKSMNCRVAFSVVREGDVSGTILTARFGFHPVRRLNSVNIMGVKWKAIRPLTSS